MNNDIISRQAAIDDILRRLDTLKMTEFGTGTFRDGVADGYARIISDLKSLPSAQPERHGHWIENETSYADHPTKQTCNCSVCKRASTRPLGDWCRWCGADMRGEQDG